MAKRREGEEEEIVEAVRAYVPKLKLMLRMLGCKEMQGWGCDALHVLALVCVPLILFSLFSVQLQRDSGVIRFALYSSNSFTHTFPIHSAHKVDTETCLDID